MKSIIALLLFNLFFLTSFSYTDTIKTDHKVFYIQNKLLLRKDIHIDKIDTLDFKYVYLIERKYNFIYLKTGDMKGLVTLKGQKLLGASHFISFNQEKRFISAYVCEDQSWVFLNFQGDTLSSGGIISNNYVPKLDQKANLSYDLDKDKGLTLGFLNQKAEWIIPPKIDSIIEHNEKYWKVRIDNEIKYIDKAGEYITKPKK